MKRGVSFTTRDELRWTSTFGLPVHLLARARARVRLISLLGMGGFALFLAFGFYRESGEPGYLVRNRFNLAGDTFAFLVSATLYVVSAIERIGEKRFLDLALAASVVVCADISVVAPWYYWLNAGISPYDTWVTGIIIMVPLILPVPPRRTIPVSVLSALTVPLGLFVVQAIGVADPKPSDYLLIAISPVIAVVVASLASREIYGINRRLVAAEQVAGYNLEKKIGEGGMGVVWLATHRLLARPTAIKLIRPEKLQGLGPKAKERVIGQFEREAKATATMQSPHTVNLYDFGVSDRGGLYYAMEYLDGMDFDSLVARAGALPPARIVYLLRQACDSLAEAHFHRLIHRDIKPSNLYLCRFARHMDFVKVLDFGIAKAMDPGPDDPGSTHSSAVVGSPNFIAPEQVTDPSSVGPLSDIYSLGCVAYWLLTGELVFEGASSMETMNHHVHTAPVPPSRRSGGRGIPPSLEAVVLQCLEKDPGRRPPSMDALDGALAEVPIENPWTAQDAASWWEER